MNTPRIGFAGVGRIGNRRLQAILGAESAEVVGVLDPDGRNIRAALDQTGLKESVVVPDLEALLGLDLDGVVISTPNHLHADQSVEALEGQAGVFCQKPLGCNRGEVDRVIDTARRVDRLLGVDLTYRRAPAMQAIRRRVAAGEIGDVYAADLVFHNAYGPDKTWFYDRIKSGGGCFLDLGVHLVDLALWVLDFPRVDHVTSRFYSRGHPIRGSDLQTVEDYALARLDFDTGATAQLACSWHLSAGCDAVVRATFHGTNGTLHMYNQDGSYFDLVAEKLTGREREVIAVPNGKWDSNTAIEWTRRLRESNRFESEAVRHAEIAHVLDQVYAQ